MNPATRIPLFAAAATAAFAATPATAAETVAYGYDARGRLVKVERSGGVATLYTFDRADNRISVTTTGASGGPTTPAGSTQYRVIPTVRPLPGAPAAGVVVVPVKS